MIPKHALKGILAALLLSGCASARKSEWHSLLGESGLGGWRKAEFDGSGEPRVEDGKLILPAGDNLTGVVWTRELPQGDYEVTLEAMRVSGGDIFCGLTFPVADSHASLILGGWGGSVCGISSLDGMDASENSTTKARDFVDGKWYGVRLRVAKGHIEAWVDGEQLVNVATEGHRVSTRWSMRAAEPFGLASWRTTAALRSVRWRNVEREAQVDEIR